MSNIVPVVKRATDGRLIVDEAGVESTFTDAREAKAYLYDTKGYTRVAVESAASLEWLTATRY